MKPSQETHVSVIIRQLIEEWFAKGRQFENDTNPFALDNNAVEFAVGDAVDEIKSTRREAP